MRVYSIPVDVPAMSITLFSITEKTNDDKELVAHILDPVQQKHAKLSVESKGKTIEEIHAKIFGR